MHAEFQVSKLLGSIEINDGIRALYERTIEAVVLSHQDDWNIDKLEGIIIPDDFVAGVMEFQKNVLKEENPSVTDNEYGRAYGKMMYDPAGDRYYVFLDSQFATFLMGDDFFNSCFPEGHPGRATSLMVRQQALNLLFHEISHTEFDQRIQQPVITKSLDGGLTKQAYILLDEYYACRKAARIANVSIHGDEVSFVTDLEDRIDVERWRYKRREIDLNTFVGMFHAYTKMALIRLVSILGANDAVGDKKLPFPGTKLFSVGVLLNKEFSKLFDAIEAGKTIDIPKEVKRAIHFYFHQLGVDIEDRSKGLYYSIPD